MNEPEVGYGYRRLRVGEAIEPGDDYWNAISGRWEASMVAGQCGTECGKRRRKIDPGEGWEIVPAGEILEDGDMFLGSDGTWYLCEGAVGLRAGPDALAPALPAFRRRIQPAGEPSKGFTAHLANPAPIPLDGIWFVAKGRGFSTEENAIDSAKGLAKADDETYYVCRAVHRVEVVTKETRLE